MKNKIEPELHFLAYVVFCSFSNVNVISNIPEHIYLDFDYPTPDTRHN